MFCPQCGKQLEDGKSFCKFCGARVNAEPAPPPTPSPPVGGQVPQPPPSAPQTPAPPLPGDPDETHVGLPPLPSADSVWHAPGVTPPPTPPPPSTAPAPSTAAFPLATPSPPAGEYDGPPPTKRPSWVVPFLAVIGILIVTTFIVLAVLLLGDSGDGPKATDPVATGTTGSPTTLTSATVPATPDTAGGGGVLTTATIPRYDPDAATTPPTGATTQDETAYMNALDNLESALSRADDRVPALATEINNTAPNVPGSVEEELGRLQQDVENAQSTLGSHDPPQRYQRADELIFNAADEMLYRIDQTRQGIDAMRRAGRVDAGAPYFDAGRVARDQFRTFFDQYRSTRP